MHLAKRLSEIGNYIYNILGKLDLKSMYKIHKLY